MKTLSLFAELQDTAPVSVEVDAVTLRPYQLAAVDGVYREWDAGNVSTLVAMPTGTGKSVVFSEVMRRWNGGRMLVLAHRSELIYQAQQHARNAGLTAGVEMAGERAGRRDDVVVSSVQTQCAWRKCTDCRGEGCDFCGGAGKVRRMLRFRPRDFGLLIIDEAHHATATTYRIVQEYYRQNPDLRILLVTATPKRSDKVGLHNVADSVAYELGLKQAIADGWLCPIRQRFIEVHSLKLGDVGTKAGGDLADGQLERAWLEGTTDEQKEKLHAVAKPLIEEARGRRALLFCSGIEHAKLQCAAINSYDGVRAEVVTQDTPKQERRDIVARYKAGETTILVNVGVFTEGFDAPGTQIVANARPTKSESLYLQMIGRGTRPLKGVVDGPQTAEARRAAIAASAKPHCIVIDFVGDSGKHKLISTGDILAGDDVDPVDLEAALTCAARSAEPVDIEEQIEKAKQAREEKAARLEAERQRIVSMRQRAEHCEYSVSDVDLFGPKGFDPFEHYDPVTGGATQKQVYALMKLGVPWEQAVKYSKAGASRKIDEISGANKGGDFRMPFGKYAGKRLKEIPYGYRQWMRANLKHPKVQENLRAMG